jgi:hypothetical protein
MLPTVTGAKAELSQHNTAPHMAALQHAVDDGSGGRDDGGGSGVAEGYRWLGAVLECCLAAAACYLKANWTILSSYGKVSYTIKNQS